MHLGAGVGVVAPMPDARGGEGPLAAERRMALPAGFGVDAQVRRGFGDGWEAGLRAAPGTFGADGRLLLWGERKWLLTAGAGIAATLPAAMLVDDVRRYDLDSGSRVEGAAELLFGRNWSDVLRLWIGPRVGAGRFTLSGTDAETGAAHEASGATGFAGGTLGIGAGYRTLHAFAELAAAWGIGAEQGFVIAPAFGLWARF
jgi:hypothetical protein